MQFCTDRQAEVLETYILCGMSSRRAAAKLNIGDRSVRETISRVKKKAAAAGWTDNWNATKFVDPGQVVTGKSTLTKDDDGNTVWIKTTKEKRNIDIANELSESVALIKPWPKVKTPKVTNRDLATVYTITDYHIGMYSWKPESGADWDTKIAEKVLMNSISDMTNASPDSELGIFVQMGDFLHWDGLDSITPMNRNPLDADGRYQKLTALAVTCCINAVNIMLESHKKVHVIMAEGNHDLAGSVWLRLMMEKTWENNPRVTVDNSPFPFYKYVFGKVFLGWHHGHLIRIKDLAGKFYSEFGKEMGAAKWRRLHTGHTHQAEVHESAGVITERHPTLAARDSYGARGFHKTVRAAQAITYHKDLGEFARNIVYPREK